MSARLVNRRRWLVTCGLALLLSSAAWAQRSVTNYVYNDTFDLVRQYTSDPDDPENNPKFNNTLYAYDELGRMTASVLTSDPTRVAYDGASNGPDAVTLYVYDSADHVVKTIRKGKTGQGANNTGHGPEPGDAVTTYEFDALGRQTKTLLPDGGETILTYDLADNVVQSRTLLRAGVYATTTYEYDAANRRTLSTDANGSTGTSYFTSGAVRRTEQKDAAGARFAASQFDYDSALRLFRETHYDPVPVGDQGWTPDEATDAITDYLYDADGRIELAIQFHSQIDQQGSPEPIIHAYSYDSIGRLVDAAAPMGVNAHVDYDPTWKGSPDKITRTDGMTPALVTDPTYHPALPIVVELTRGPNGGPLPQMLTWSFVHNALQRVVSSTDPLTRVEQSDVDARGQQVLLTEDHGEETENRLTRTERDRNGLPTTLTAEDSNGAPQPTSYTYDLLDRAIHVEYPSGSGADELALEYDLAGRLTKQTLQNGHVLTYEHDARDNLLTKTLGDGGTPDSYRHTYEYDALSRVTLARRERLDPPAGILAETTFAYDGLSRVTAETQKLFGETTGRTLTYQYDQRGNRVSMQFAPTLPEKLELKYHYDELNQNTLVQARFNTKRNTNRTNYIDLLRYDYSGSILQSRVIRTLYNDEAPYVNAELELAQVFTYDQLRRPIAIANKTHWGAQQLNLDELAQYHYEYDKLSNPLTATGDYALASNEGYSYIQDRPTLGYDRLNRLTSLEQNDHHNGLCTDESFEYDHLGNLDTGHYLLGCSTLDDPYAYASDVANQYTALDRDAQTFGLAYNAVGGLARRDVMPEGGENPCAQLFFYDDEQRLVRIEYGVPGANLERGRFEYDALGRLIYSWTQLDTNTGDSDAREVWYYHDGGEAIAEYEPLGNGTLKLLRRHIHGTARVDERAVLIEGHLGVPILSPQPTAECYYYILQDLDTVAAVMKQNGNLCESMVYAGYGRATTIGYPRGDFNRDGHVTPIDLNMFLAAGPLFPPLPTPDPVFDLDLDGDRDFVDFGLIQSGQAAAPQRVSTVGNPFAFTGRRLMYYEQEPDPNNGAGGDCDGEGGVTLLSNEQLQFNRNRWYDLETSRWLTRDPKGFVDGMSLYEYCKSNPTRNTDPMGTDSIDYDDDGNVYFVRQGATLSGWAAWYTPFYGEQSRTRIGRGSPGDAFAYIGGYPIPTAKLESVAAEYGLDSSVEDYDDPGAWGAWASQYWADTLTEVLESRRFQYETQGINTSGRDTILGVDWMAEAVERHFEQISLRDAFAQYIVQQVAEEAVTQAATFGAGKTLDVISELADVAKDAVKATRAASKAQRAAAMVVGSVARGELPTLVIDFEKYPEMADNIWHAQKAGHPRILTHGGNKELNRLKALGDVPKVSPLWRDEYPFAASREGGSGAWVGHIPADQQRAQGTMLSDLIRRNRMNPGDRYRVLVINHPKDIP